MSNTNPTETEKEKLHTFYLASRALLKSGVVPPMAVQRLFDGLADNGADRLFAHQRAVRDFHDALRARFYPFVFEARPMSAADLATLPRPRPAASMPRPVPIAWAGLLLALLLLLPSLAREAGRSRDPAAGG